MKNSLLFISVFMLLMACQENKSTNKSIDKEETANTEKITKMKKVLFILTSHDELGDTGKKTGFWIEEFASPYYFLKDKGVEITLASPKGGQLRCPPNVGQKLAEFKVEFYQFCMRYSNKRPLFSNIFFLKKPSLLKGFF
jgi:hypothetical protein